MKALKLLLALATLRGVPAPQMATEQDLDIDRRRPRTLVEDFIKDARPYESALPDGVEPAAEVLQHFPVNSYEKCPDLEAYSRTVREAATGPAVMQYLEKHQPDRNPHHYKLPTRREEYLGRKWRGLESDALWAVQELRTKGFVALREVVPKDEVVALRTKAEDSWCAVANALHERNMSHCLWWQVQELGSELFGDAKRSEVKYTHEYVVHEPGALGGMELVLGSESALVVGAHKRVLKKMWPVLKRIRPDLAIDERGFLRNQNPHGGYWHLDVEADPAIKGTSFTLYVVLQDFNATNGGTHFVPWDEDYIVSPDLPAGSVILYDSVGLYHRAGDHRPPPGVRDVARWVTWTTLVSAAHPDHLYPFQNGEFSLFDVLGKDEEEYDTFIKRVAAAKRSEKKKLKREQELKAADPDNLPPHLRGAARKSTCASGRPGCIIYYLAASTQRESAWRPRTRRLRLPHPNV